MGTCNKCDRPARYLVLGTQPLCQHHWEEPFMEKELPTVNVVFTPRKAVVSKDGDHHERVYYGLLFWWYLVLAIRKVSRIAKERE